MDFQHCEDHYLAWIDEDRIPLPMIEKKDVLADWESLSFRDLKRPTDFTGAFIGQPRLRAVSSGERDREKLRVYFDCANRFFEGANVFQQRNKWEAAEAWALASLAGWTPIEESGQEFYKPDVMRSFYRESGLYVESPIRDSALVPPVDMDDLNTNIGLFRILRECGLRDIFRHSMLDETYQIPAELKGAEEFLAACRQYVLASPSLAAEALSADF